MMLRNPVHAHIFYDIELFQDESKQMKARHENIATSLHEQGLTFILGSEFPHLRRKAFVELVLPGDERLADCLFAES